MAFGGSGLPFGPGGPGVSVGSSMMGMPRQPVRGALNLARPSRLRSPKLDRGGPLMGIMRMLAAKRSRFGGGGAPSSPVAPKPPMAGM